MKLEGTRDPSPSAELPRLFRDSSTPKRLGEAMGRILLVAGVLGVSNTVPKNLPVAKRQF